MTDSTDCRYAAWIGLDWARNAHAIALQVADSSQVEVSTVEQTPEALHEWLASVLVRFPERDVAIALEQSKGAVIHFLLGFQRVHIFRINPKSLKNYRESLFPSGAKDDPTDAQLLLQFLKFHAHLLKAWVPDDAPSRALLRLVEFRRKTVGHRTAVSNALSQMLTEYFPQALDWAGSLNTTMACDFLSQWPTLQKLQNTKAQKVRRFYQAHGCRRQELIDERLKEIRSAIPLTEDTAVVSTAVIMVQTLVSQLRDLQNSIAVIDEHIETLFAQHPDHDLFDSFPGAGAVMAPRLQAAMGSDRNRFDSPEEVQNYSGIAPVTEKSGKSASIHRRRACSKFVRQSFHEYALHSIGQCAWAKAYYRLQRSRGNGHQACVRALAYKWIRIIYRCWKDRVPYDDAKYLASLRSRHSECLKYLPAAG